MSFSLRNRSEQPSWRNILKIEILSGNEVDPFACELGWVRMSHFREYPYLYDANIVEESKYLSDFLNSDDKLLVRITENGTLLSLLSGYDFASESEILDIAAREVGDLGKTFYFAEFIVEKHARKRGLSRLMMESALPFISSLGYQTASILTVQRNSSDPRMKKGYTSSDPVWSRLGFKKTSTSCDHEWATFLDADLSKSKPVLNTLNLWTKTL